MRDGVRIGTKAESRGRNVDGAGGHVQPRPGSVQGFMAGLGN